MLPNDRAQPAARDKSNLVERVQQATARARLPRRIVMVVCAVVFCCPVLAPVAVVNKVRTRMASAYVAMVAVWLIYIVYLYGARPSWAIRWALIALPVAVAVVAHVGTLRRWYVPCRTVAVVLVWPVLVVVALSQLNARNISTVVGVVAAWLLAAVALGWRLAKAIQDSRMYSGRTPDGQPGPASHGHPAGPAQGRPAAGQPGPGQPGYSVPARAAALPYAEHAARDHLGGSGPQRPRPQISVEDAMAELDAMIGLTSVKEQVRSIAASVEAARRRTVAGITTERPMRHFVFLGPPGTGKTTVARVLAKIFYAFGLLQAPEVIEAHRADLVGEYLGATAIKTNELVDSALGGVLFIDEAYSLVNEGDGQADRFGVEAVQTLLKRAEDNRESLIIILAGYEKQMESFLASNPGLASRFATRLKFPSYSPNEMMALAQAAIERRGERLDGDARPVLYRKFEEVGRRRIADDLGNGRFVRSLIEKAGQARDVRVITSTTNPAEQDLLTIRAGDLEQGYAELTSRLRGYEDTPTVEGALAELDWLVGLDPVKQQVRAIAAQLRVAKMRSRQGLSSQPPARHFVFTGPPGTGKTTVSRILGRIFAAHGLLVRPEVIEAHRADLVGEHLGSTAIKTGKLIDSAMGGVLFIDEAYSLNNVGYDGGDAFGSEAVQTLLKRAEDDRDRLVIVLAGYPDDMDRFLRSNPGLASRFSTRVTFPSYSPNELVEISGRLAKGADDRFDPAALEVLRAVFAHACAEGRIDELGNGRFARSLYERACACRDLRVENLADPSRDDLIILTDADVQAAYRELDHGSPRNPIAVPEQN
ncbi:MAG: AAA family ATPase [Streptosporangiaceae bacterium]